MNDQNSRDVSGHVGQGYRASIDLGTNTCLLLIQDASGKVIHDESNVVRLGESIFETGMFQDQAMKRTIDVLKKYQTICTSNHIDPKQVIAVGTASARTAKNAKLFFERIETDLGFQFRTLTGDEEAKATFLGACLPGIDPKKMIVMDIGGGSTELVQHTGGVSINIGAVKITELFLKSNPVTDSEYWNAQEAIDQELKTIAMKFDQGFQFVAVAGTATTLAQLHLSLSEFDEKQINQVTLTKGDIHRWVGELKWRSIEERKLMPGMEIKRADVLLGGAMIFHRVMEFFNFTDVRISTRGLRYGVFEI